MMSKEERFGQDLDQALAAASSKLRRDERQPTDEEIKDMHRDAIQVQDACNLSGVVFAFARHMQTLCDMGLDTDAKNSHPVSVLFSSKISALTRSESSTSLLRAYDTAEKITGRSEG